MTPRSRGALPEKGLEMRTLPDLDPALAHTFAELDRHEIRWCVLRGELAKPSKREEIDLLIAREDRDRAARLLEGLGYLPLPSWGRASHRFFVAYVAKRDAWIKLDVVTALSFGPHAAIETKTAGACLARRTATATGWALADADRFWAVLLHCILDRGDVPPRHATVIHDLAERIAPDGPLATWFAANGPPGWDPSRVIAAAAAADWPALIEMGRAMLAARRWNTGRPLALRLGRSAARRLTKLRRFMLEPGISVALLGPDGTGKSSLAAHLGRSFYFPAESVYMGLYGGGRRPPPRGAIQHVSRTSGHLVRQWGRYVGAVVHRRRGRLVIYDRFGYDALLRQPANPWIGTRLRRWALSHAVPSPDLVVALDAPAPALYARKQEHDLPALEWQRGAYLALAARLKNVAVVRTDRTIEEVRREVTRLIWEQYLSRRRRRRARA